jgi:hypothetical protein
MYRVILGGVIQLPCWADGQYIFIYIGIFYIYIYIYWLKLVPLTRVLAAIPYPFCLQGSWMSGCGFCVRVRFRHKVFGQLLCLLLVFVQRLCAARFGMRAVGVHAMGDRLQEVSTDTLGRTLSHLAADSRLAFALFAKLGLVWIVLLAYHTSELPPACSPEVKKKSSGGTVRLPQYPVQTRLSHTRGLVIPDRHSHCYSIS